MSPLWLDRQRADNQDIEHKDMKAIQRGRWLLGSPWIHLWVCILPAGTVVSTERLRCSTCAKLILKCDRNRFEILPNLKNQSMTNCGTLNTFTSICWEKKIHHSPLLTVGCAHNTFERGMNGWDLASPWNLWIASLDKEQLSNCKEMTNSSGARKVKGEGPSLTNYVLSQKNVGLTFMQSKPAPRRCHSPANLI